MLNFVKCHKMSVKSKSKIPVCNIIRVCVLSASFLGVGFGDCFCLLVEYS